MSLSSPQFRLPECNSFWPWLGPRDGCVATASSLRFRSMCLQPRPLALPLSALCLGVGSPPNLQQMPLIAFARKKNLRPQPPSVEKVSLEVGDDEELEDDILFQDLDDEVIDDNEDHVLSLEEEDVTCVGDGAGGGGISLAGTVWDKKALEIAEKVVKSFNGELGIYALRTLHNAAVQVRVERLTNKFGSPSMADIESFSSEYRMQLDESEASGLIPNLSLEVSSPGVERVVGIPDDLERFKDRNMYVKYMSEDSSIEQEGVLRLISFESDSDGGCCSCSCTWGLADVRVNRDKSGKGRPLSKKHKDWRLVTPLDSLSLVRLYSDF